MRIGADHEGHAWRIRMKERGAAYPLKIIAASVPPAGVLFALGWLAGRALSQF